MMTLDKSENLMSGTWTKASKVRRAFKAGPKRRTDVVYDSENAILHARIAFLEIRTAMQKEIPTGGEDVRAALVLMTPEDKQPGKVYALVFPKQIEGLPEIAAKAARLEKAHGVLPLGVAFWQKDRESKSVDVWVQPWLVNTRAQRAAVAAQRAFLESDGRETEGTFQAGA